MGNDERVTLSLLAKRLEGLESPICQEGHSCKCPRYGDRPRGVCMKSLGLDKLNLRDLLDHMERAGRQVDIHKCT